MKRTGILLLCVLAGCMLFSTACGDPSTGNKGGATELTIWIQPVNQPEYFMGWFKSAFEEEHSDITLNFVPQQSSLLSATQLDIALREKKPDMVATWGATVVPQLVRGGRLMDLTEVMPEDAELEDMALMNRVDGRHYGAPIFGFATPVIYYNKDVFDANGWSEPTDYQSFVQLCKNITAVRDENNRQKYQPLTTDSPEHIMTSLHGKTMTSEELNACMEDWSASELPIDNEGFTNGFRWAADMLANGVFETNISGIGSEAVSNFTLQKALMISMESLDLLDLSYQCTFEIGSFLFPDPPAQWSSGENDGKVCGIYTDVLCINSNTEFPDACKKVIEFLYSDEAQEKLFDYYLYPVKKGISYENVDPTKKAVFDEAFKPIYDQAAENGMTPYYSEYFHTALPANLRSAFNTISRSPDESTVLEEVQRILDYFGE